MVLASKIFSGALQIGLDLNIQKNRCLDPEIRISGSGWTGRALKKISEPSQFIQKSRFPDLGICFSGYSDPDQSVGLRKKFYLPKLFMGPIFCYWHILIQPFLLEAPFIEIVLCSKVIPDFRIQMNREGSEKNYTCQNHIWTTTFVTNKFWFGPSF